MIRTRLVQMIMILKMITLGTGAKHRSTCAFIALFYLYVVVVVCWLYLIMRDSLLSFFFLENVCCTFACKLIRHGT